MFSAEHPHGMGSEMKPVVIKIPSVEAWMIKPTVRRQVLSSRILFCLVSPIRVKILINKRCEWQLIRDSTLSKIDSKWWWKSARDTKGQEKNFLLLLVFLYLSFLRNGMFVYFTINFWKCLISPFIKKLAWRALQRSSVVKGWLLALLNAGYSFKQSLSIMIE